MTEDYEKKIKDLLKKLGFKLIAEGQSFMGGYVLTFLNKDLNSISVEFDSLPDDEDIANVLGLDERDLPVDCEEAEKFLKKEWEKVK